MKKIRNLLMIIISVIGCFAVPANASTKKEQALQAYASILQQSSVKGAGKYWPMTDAKFSLIYLDNNKVPELLITARDRFVSWKGLFTYKKGRVTVLYDGPVGVDADFQGYYKKTGIFYREYCHLGEMKTYYRLTNGKLKMIGTRGEKMFSTIDTPVPNSYSWNRRNMSRSEFFRKLSQATKRRKLTKPKYFRNTEANRVKFLGCN